MDQYNAFISYSHDDLAFAERISKRLRRYKAPKSTGLHEKPLKIFRDVERLTADPDLSDALEERLRASEKLILLCSPSAANSPYVKEELFTFLKLKSYDDLLFVVCRGNLEEGVPSEFLKEEPLFIDLNGASKKQFREGTLRLIAALHAVDYAILSREDEKLRRKKWNITVLSFFSLIFLIFSGFLITNTKAETWERVQQPILDQDVMPIHEYAVNEEDPTIILYEGEDAKWGMNPRPEGFSMLPNSSFPNGGPDFNNSLKDYRTDPLVRIRFELTDRNGYGEVDVYGILNSSENELYYYRSLKFNGQTKDGVQKQVLIPPNIESITSDPYNLSPWPLDTLSHEKLYSEWDEINGTLINLITGEEVETTFEQEYFDFGYDEWVEIWDPAYRVFSNVDAESLVVLGDTLVYVENENQIWDSIVKSSKWNTYSKPQRFELGSVYEDTEEDILEVIDAIPYTVKSDSLLSQLSEFSRAAEFTVFNLITSSKMEKGALAIEAKGIIDTPENVDGIPLKWLFRADSSSAWHPVLLPGIEAGTSIIDIVSITSTEAFIVTDTHGFFLTEDSGRSWQEANFGETNLGNGRFLKTVVGGVPAQVYCLVDRNISFNDGENALFRFVRRNWVQRWKAGLIEILK